MEINLTVTINALNELERPSKDKDYLSEINNKFRLFAVQQRQI